MKIIAFDKSILRELDILYTVPCSSCRTAEEKRSLLKLKKECEVGKVSSIYIENAGQGYGYYAPTKESDIKEMLKRWDVYLNDMQSKRIKQTNPLKIAMELKENGIKYYLSYFSKAKLDKVYEELTNVGISIITPEKIY